MDLAGRLRGIFPPLVTPFTSDGALDLLAFESNLAAYADTGLAGVLVLGSNGEANVLEEPEKLELIRAARRLAGGKPLLAGAGLESTRATIALARKAADAGADAVLVLPPFYFRTRMTDDALRRHFEAVAEASPVPVLLYSVPAVTGSSLSLALVTALARHVNVAGIKESSGDVALLARLAATAPGSFATICGSGPVMYPALCVGARAGILAVACCCPRQAVALFEAQQSGDHARARRIQEALSPLAAAVTTGHGVPGLKAAMELAGLRGGGLRSPLLPVPDAVREELLALLRRAEAAA